MGALKIIIAAFFASCVVSLAQPTNVDPSTGMPRWPADGKITDTNLLAPVSFTNSFGDLITNAIPVRLFANKLVYITTDYGGGTIRLGKLPPDLQKKFGYNPANAAAADETDRQKHQAQLERNKQAAIAFQQNAEYEMRKSILKKGSRTIDGRVIQKIPAGLLVDSGREQLDEEGRTASGVSPDGSGSVWWSGPEHIREADSPGAYCLALCLLTDYPKYDQTTDGDYIHILAYPTGQYIYTTVQNSSKTVRRFSYDFDVAMMKYNLTH
jgi:hypothetical protein